MSQRKKTTFEVLAAIRKEKEGAAQTSGQGEQKPKQETPQGAASPAATQGPSKVMELLQKFKPAPKERGTEYEAQQKAKAADEKNLEDIEASVLKRSSSKR